MQDDNSELILLVTSVSKDGSQRYDAQSTCAGRSVLPTWRIASNFDYAR
jgi:hypothetical protein